METQHFPVVINGAWPVAEDRKGGRSYNRA
jgi:hypothetical protein